MKDDVHHLAAIQRYHTIRKRCGLEAATSCVLQNSKHGFIRGRKADPNRLRPEANHFSYPPPRFCTAPGRANIPGFPVFYAGETPEIIADEIRLVDGDWLHLAVFYTPAPVEMTILMLLHDGFRGDSEWASLRDELRAHVDANPGGFGPTPLQWSRIESTALQFRTDDYADTAAISHFWLYEKALDGIVYPSIRDDRWCNFALAPRFVDTHLIMHCVYTCRWLGGRLQAYNTGRDNGRGRMDWSSFSLEDYDLWESGFARLVR